jgi:glyoxylase-like metal-dependent hydrolase (beta-lactamase superfamily II)
MKPKVKAFFDPDTSTLTYVVFDEDSRDAVVMDTVWNYDQNAAKLTTKSCDEVLAFISENRLLVHLIMETHAHADHISAAQLAKKAIPKSRVVIGQRICDVQKEFGRIYNLQGFEPDGRLFDVLLGDGESINAGTLKIETIFTPGHTPACASYLIGDAVFTGDALFMPDFGTGRCDFPLASAADLYDSVHNRLYKLPEATRTFTAHDYQPGGRPLRYESTIGEQKQSNIHIKASTSKDEYVALRTSRDATLAIPRLLLASVQVNINAGHLPAPESNQVSYLKIPLSNY